MTWVYVWMCMEFQCPCSTPLRIIWMISSDKCSTFYAVLNAHLSYLNDRWKHTIRVKLHFGHWTFYISRFTNSRPKVFQTTCAHMRICDRRPFSSSSRNLKPWPQTLVQHCERHLERNTAIERFGSKTIMSCYLFRCVHRSSPGVTIVPYNKLPAERSKWISGPYSFYSYLVFLVTFSSYWNHFLRALK